MKFRRKLLIVFALTVFVSVAVVTGIISSLTRSAFEKENRERAATLVAQFQREFERRGEEVANRVEAVAGDETVARMAIAVSRGAPDYAAYLNAAGTIANSRQLDFLEFVDSQGTIISSAQWPARFGYKEAQSFSPPPKQAFLRQEQLADGAALGVFSVKEAGAADKPFFVIGGRRLDQSFMASLDLPSGMRAFLYQNREPEFSPRLLIDASGLVKQAANFAPIIQEIQRHPRQTVTVMPTSSDDADDVSLTAIPLAGIDNKLLGVLLVENSLRPYVELQRRIRTAAFVSAGAGFLLAILLSGWAASRVTRPVEQLAQAARAVAVGDWNTHVPVSSTDELGELAEAFNRMTRELQEQKQRLVQSERVAAWRELARRLAHELKNPLFPLQLTVENLLRARQLAPGQFDEVFQESSTTLLAEIGHLRTIISRFSEFSSMPRPQFQWVDANTLVQNVARLHLAQMRSRNPGSEVECRLDLAGAIEPIAADPDLLHRALSNLVLNAMEAMPQGGTLTLRTAQKEGNTLIEVSDTGAGLSQEECAHLFTPYYTKKVHGTGLGLAIVQSVISDHGGRISVRSQPGRGASFVIELPPNPGKITPQQGTGKTV